MVAELETPDGDLRRRPAGSVDISPGGAPEAPPRAAAAPILSTRRMCPGAARRAGFVPDALKNCLSPE